MTARVRDLIDRLLAPGPAGQLSASEFHELADYLIEVDAQLQRAQQQQIDDAALELSTNAREYRTALQRCLEIAHGALAQRDACPTCAKPYSKYKAVQCDKCGRPLKQVSLPDGSAKMTEVCDHNQAISPIEQLIEAIRKVCAGTPMHGVADDAEAQLVELREIAKGLADFDWCAGYEMSSAQHTELYELRGRAIKITYGEDQ